MYVEAEASAAGEPRVLLAAGRCPRARGRGGPACAPVQGAGRPCPATAAVTDRRAQGRPRPRRRSVCLRLDRGVRGDRTDDLPSPEGAARGRADRLTAARYLGVLLDRARRAGTAGRRVHLPAGGCGKRPVSVLALLEMSDRRLR